MSTWRSAVSGFGTDLRRAMRLLTREPRFAITAIATLALGLGANTALFALISATLLRPMDLGSPERIVRLVPQHPRFGESDLTFALADLADLEREARTLEAVAAYDGWSTTLTTPDGAERVEGAIVSPSYFTVVDVRPALGRFFGPDQEDAAGAPVVVLGYALWRNHFGADSSLIGRAVRLNGQEHIVIGVAPRTFEDPRLARGGDATPELWRPPPSSWTQGDRVQRGYRSVTAIARLAHDVPIEQAQVEVGTIFGRLAAAHPETNAERSARVVPLREHIVAPIRPAMVILFAASTVVLLIACANLANLMMARVARRRRQFAMQMALGASRARIARQVLAESAVLTVLGGLAGVWVASVVGGLITRFGAGHVPRLAAAAPDARVLIFALLAPVGVALLVAALPALRAARTAVHPSLKEGDSRSAGAQGQRSVRGALIALESALAVALLVSAGLLVRSLWNLHAVDPGLRPEGVLTSRLEISRNSYDSEPEVAAVFDRISTAVGALPGVESVGFVNVLPFSGGYWRTRFTVEGRQVEAGGTGSPSAELRTASSGYFDALDVVTIEGRTFTDADAHGARPVVVVNRTLAEQHWPDERRVGRRVVVEETSYDVIGVIEDIQEFALDRPAEPVLYLAHAQAPSWLTRYAYMVVRTAGDPHQLVPPTRRTIRSIDGGIPVSEVRTMREVIGSTIAPQSFRTVLLVLLGALACVLAGIGVLGVASYSVAQRTREIGVRMALGARAGDISSLIVRQELPPVVLGIVAGVIASLGATQLLAGLLFGVAPADAVTLVAAPLLLLLVAAVAILFPVRRAIRIDPVGSLRHE